jgi:hypothetical protein
MKPIYFIAILFLSGLLTACYDDDSNPVEDLSTLEPGHSPVSGNTFVDLVNPNSKFAYTGGTALAFELVYWSDDPIKEINLYESVGADSKKNIVHALYGEVAAFSKIKSAETLVFHYTTPLVAQKTAIKFDIEIINENARSLNRTLSITVNP